MMLSVIIPTHNPRMDYLHEVLSGLRDQTLRFDDWELLIVDNCSEVPLATRLDLSWHSHANIFCEERLGLSNARCCGISAAKGRFLILVDDDNVMASNYLENVVRLFESNSCLGAIGGRSLPRFEGVPPRWINEFLGLLACRDLGTEPHISQGLYSNGSDRVRYPLFAPIGAGMALRSEAAQVWLREEVDSRLSDRRGNELTSGGDNDLVLTIMGHGWEVGYFPELLLTHLIPVRRIESDYLARLNQGIQKSWMQVLTKHNVCPWPLIPRWTVPCRKLKAWFTYRAWVGPAERIRWRGACGHFEGRLASVKLL